MIGRYINILISIVALVLFTSITSSCRQHNDKDNMDSKKSITSQERKLERPATCARILRIIKGQQSKYYLFPMTSRQVPAEVIINEIGTSAESIQELANCISKMEGTIIELFVFEIHGIIDPKNECKKLTTSEMDNLKKALKKTEKYIIFR